MIIKNAAIISTLHNLLTDLKLRHLGGELFLEATTPPMLSKSPMGPSFLLFDMERQFAVVLQENTHAQRHVSFSPVILAEFHQDVLTSVPSKTLHMGHGEYKEMSLLIAYWFLRAKSDMGKEATLQFLRTTYGDIAPVQWGNMSEPMEDMERFLRNLKVPIVD